MCVGTQATQEGMWMGTYVCTSIYREYNGYWIVLLNVITGSDMSVELISVTLLHGSVVIEPSGKVIIGNMRESRF